MKINSVKDNIHILREKQVILDRDLAELYDVDVKRINEQVKRNNERFPQDFMFQVTTTELEILKSQFATSSWGGRRKLPFAFTEQGVAMLSGLLRSKKAIEVNIQIMRTFVEMRKFLSLNAQIFNRLDFVEKKQIEHNNKFEELFDRLQNKIPEKGIFFEGQIFDAYKFISDLIKSAHKHITLIDNYVDESVLMLLNKRKKEVKVTILTKTIPKELVLDMEKYNSQYPEIKVKKFSISHDRFLIIDNKEIYHIGASLKDLGKKWFAFSKLDKNTSIILDKIDDT